jgi:nucleoside-diphosphate-sugar epimerase
MKVLILGGTGFIGAHVARLLGEAGNDVWVFHRGQTRAELPAAVRSLHGDRRRLRDFAAELVRLAPDVVIDVTPYTQREAQQVVDVFRGTAKRMVALSSGDVYRNYDGLRRVWAGPPDPCPLAEDAPLREHLYPYRAEAAGPDDWLFDYEKLLVERVVLGESELPGTVLRLPMVYGPGDHHHRLASYLWLMKDRRGTIQLTEGQSGWRWTRGYVENVAAAIALAAVDDRAVGSVYNVGEADAQSEAEWVAAVGRAAGWGGEVVTVTSGVLPTSSEPDFDWRFDLATDTRRIREHLGFVEPVSREEALRRAVAWEREHAREG